LRDEALDFNGSGASCHTYERWVALNYKPLGATTLKNSEEIELARHMSLRFIHHSSWRRDGVFEDSLLKFKVVP
jgi:hypothetical protein